MGYLIIFAAGFLSGALSVVTWALVVAAKRYEAEQKEAVLEQEAESGQGNTKRQYDG